MYKVAICDDNVSFLRMIEKKVQAFCRDNGIDVKAVCFSESGEIMDLIHKEQIFDAYILDIEMPEYSGMEVVEALQKYADRTKVVLLTAHNSYAVKACGMQVVRYVMKEHFEEEIEQALETVFSSLAKVHYERLYLIENKQRFLRICQKSILYIRKNQKNALFFLEDGSEVKERRTLQKVYEKLNNDEMMFVDRSIIINLFHVKGIWEHTVEMDDGYCFTTNQEHISELKKVISRYWGSML